MAMSAESILSGCVAWVCFKIANNVWRRYIFIIIVSMISRIYNNSHGGPRKSKQFFQSRKYCNLLNMARKSQRRRIQRGGVGHAYNLTKEKIGGLPEVGATSDCPAVGPADPKFAAALYGGARRRSRRRQSLRRAVRSHRKTKKRSCRKC